MSHFNVLVIGPKSEEALTAALQPFHEFECTGINDQYVQELDITAKVRADYERSDKSETFTQYIQDNYGWPMVPVGDGLDMEGEHKYGYILLDQAGSVVKCIDRTNPNRKWDWWQVGGRWSGMLIPVDTGKPVIGELKDGCCDSLRVGDLNLQTMRDRSWIRSNKDFDEWCSVQRGLPVARTWVAILEEHGWNQTTAGEVYYNQHRVKAIRSVLGPWDTIDLYPCVPGVDSEEKIQQVRFDAGKTAADRCLRTFAVLDARTSPTWYQRGKMGWWGSVSDAKDSDQWDREVAALIKTLNADDVITIVDCHI
jgi:hypothetical protein